MTTTEITVATAFAAGNLVLLGVLAYVWIQNYRTFRSSLILGLLAFAVVFMIENVVAVYFYVFTETMLYGADETVQRIALIKRALQFLALCFLGYVTWK